MVESISSIHNIPSNDSPVPFQTDFEFAGLPPPQNSSKYKVVMFLPVPLFLKIFFCNNSMCFMNCVIKINVIVWTESSKGGLK